MFTQLGRIWLLDSALRNTSTPIFMGLCTGEYSEDLTLEGVEEPTIGVNGYARISVLLTGASWVLNGVVNDEIYFETDWLLWTAVGGDFDKPIQRMMLLTNSAAPDAPVLALGGAFASEIVITPTTPELDRKLKFRIYAR